MLCVFGKQRASKRPGKSRRALQNAPGRSPSSATPEEEEYVFGVLDRLFNSLPRRQQHLINECSLRGGANGISHLDGVDHDLATSADGLVTVYLHTPGSSEELLADDVLDAYRAQARPWSKDCTDLPESILDAISNLRGSFALLIHDASAERVIAARDREGVAKLWWGSNMLDSPLETGLLFASERVFLEVDCADVDMFPAGAVFFSGKGETTGTVATLREPNVEGEEAAREEEESDGELMTAPMCRPASCSVLAALDGEGGAMARIPSHSQIAA